MREKNIFSGISSKLPVAVSVAAAFYFAVRYAFGILLPFVASVSVAYAAYKICSCVSYSALSRVLRIILCMLLPLFFALIPALLLLYISRVIEATSSYLRESVFSVYEFIKSLTEIIADFAGRLLPDTESEDIISRVTESVYGLITAFAGKTLPSLAGKIFNAIPPYLMCYFTFFLSLVCVSVNYEKYLLFVKKILKERYVKAVTFIKKAARSASSYFRAGLTVFLLTYAEICLGLALAGMKKPFLLAFVISSVDALPVLGSGIVLIPFAVLRLINGETRCGIILIVLFISVSISKRIFEPKIMGYATGIGFLPTLFLTYAGYRIYGVYGIIIIPAIASFAYGAFYKNEE